MINLKDNKQVGSINRPKATQTKATMKFNFENLGGIDQGSIALGDLTIICGLTMLANVHCFTPSTDFAPFQAMD